MLASGVGDDGALYGFAVERDLLDARLLAVGVLDAYVVLGLAELTPYGISLCRRGQAWVDEQSVVGGLDAEDVLTDGVPHPCCRTREP